jgi:probable rRNA maturation factor
MIKFEINQRVGKKISEKWLNKIIERTLRAAGAKNALISVAFVGNSEMKKLNKEWRGKKYATDVLSFVYETKPLAGEIIICYPRAARQAGESGHTLQQEVRTLLVHGLLHLAGYDHEKSLKEARRMEGLQNKIIQKLTF